MLIDKKMVSSARIEQRAVCQLKSRFILDAEYAYHDGVHIVLALRCMPGGDVRAPPHPPRPFHATACAQSIGRVHAAAQPCAAAASTSFAHAAAPRGEGGQLAASPVGTGGAPGGSGPFAGRLRSSLVEDLDLLPLCALPASEMAPSATSSN